MLDWPGFSQVMRRSLCWLVATVAVWAMAPTAAFAADEWGAIRVPGGVSAMRRVAGLGDGPRTKTSVIVDLVRSQFGITVKGSPESRERFTRYLDYILEVERLLAQFPEGLSLSSARADRRDPEQLRDAFAMFGLRARVTGADIVLDLDRDAAGVERRRWLRAAGIDAEDMLDALNKGESVRPVLRADEVPLPAPAFWSTQFRPGIEPLRELVATPEHLLTYFGLMDLDRETIGWFLANADVLRRVHDERSVVFSGFASGIRIRNGAVVVPGGAEASTLWERLAGASPSEPARFLINLFDRHGGRLAYFYASAASLDPARQSFLLGQASRDPNAQRARLQYVEAVLRQFAAANPTWDPQLQPLYRPPIDPAFVVAMVDVLPQGVIGPAWWPSIFTRVAGSGGWPARPKDTLSHLVPQPANASWLLAYVFEEPAQIERRWHLVRFAQRQFAAAPQSAAHEIEIALRTFKDMPALALALERMGVSSPGTFAEVASAAPRLPLATGGDDDAVYVRGWQGALAVLEQIHRHRPLEPTQLTPLLSSLARALPARPMAPSGQSTAWLLHDLLRTLDAQVEVADDMTADALRRIFAVGADAPVFTWEGVPYRIDWRTPVRESALAILTAMPGPRLQHLAGLDEGARRLAAPRTLDDVAAAIAALERVFASQPSDQLRDRINGLKKIRTAKDVPRATRERRGVLQLIDGMAAEVFPSLAYALAMSPSGLAPRSFSDSARLHTLFSRAATGRWQSYAWQPGEITNRHAGGTAIRGSLLGLDLARAQDLLARARGVVERQTAAGGSLHEITQRILVDRVALRARAAWVTDAADATAAIGRGRDRLNALKVAGTVAEADIGDLARAGVSQSRQNQLQWILGRPDRSDADLLLSISDLFHLGRSRDLTAGWGQSGRAIDGCWCVRGLDRGPLERFRGYAVGYAPAMVSDLPLRLAEVLAELHVPADVIEPMLMFAVQDVLDQAAQFAADDWETLTWSGRVSPLRVEDYLQALVSRRILAAPGR